MPNEFSQIPWLAKWLVIVIFPPVYLWLTAKPYWSWLLDRYYETFAAGVSRRGGQLGSRKTVGIIWNVVVHVSLVVVGFVLWSVYHWLRWLSGVIF